MHTDMESDVRNLPGFTPISMYPAMWAKAAGHGINSPHFVQPTRPMSAIGG